MTHMNRRSISIPAAIAVAVTAFAVAPAPLVAQDAGVAIEPARLPLSDRGIIGEALKLKEAGKLLDSNQIDAALRRPDPARLDLPAPSTLRLSAREVAARGRKGLVRLGWFYLCPRCSKWHLNLAGGYAVTADGAVATCYHCVAPKALTMREGYLIALDADNHVLPVTGVLARDPIMDVAIVRVAGGEKLIPLALNDRVAPGDPVYLYSDPMHVAGYFSTGIVNRFFWRVTGRHGDPNTLAGARAYRLHVSTDWAPGSSGAPVLDACGNVVGHVAVISSFQKPPSTSPRPAPRTGPAKQAPKDGDPKGEDEDHQPQPIAPPAPAGAGPTMMNLHEAVPARAVRLLAQSVAAAAKQDDKQEPEEETKKNGREGK